MQAPQDKEEDNILGFSLYNQPSLVKSLKPRERTKGYKKGFKKVSTKEPVDRALASMEVSSIGTTYVYWMWIT